MLEEGKDRFNLIKERIIAQGEKKKEQLIEEAEQQSNYMLIEAKRRVDNQIVSCTRKNIVQSLLILPLTLYWKGFQRR
jgi:hypothetical protein